MSKHWFHHPLLALALGALTVTAAAGAAPADAQARRATVEAAAPPTASASEGVVNIQTATPEELQRLPGIGPSKASAIVAFRERTAFRRVEDILRVRGIGRATFRRLRPYLSVSGPTTLSGDVTTRRAPPAETDEPEEADAP